jgi:hypothetical protein
MLDLASIQDLLDPLFPGLMGVRVTQLGGRTTMVWQTSIRSAEGKLCAVVTQTQLVLE